LALRTTNQKLITYPGHDEWTEVFDLAHDPYELNNLAQDSASLENLKRQFEAQSRAIGFQMPNIPKDDDHLPGKQKRRDRPVE
jgi:hypothetical protein